MYCTEEDDAKQAALEDIAEELGTTTEEVEKQISMWEDDDD